MTRLLKDNWNSKKWQTYFLFIQFKQMIRFEDSLRHIHYNFYHKFLEGQPKQMPSEIYPLFGMSLMFNTFLSEQYVKYNYNPLYVNYVKKMTDDLKYLFIKKIESNNLKTNSEKEIERIIKNIKTNTALIYATKNCRHICNDYLLDIITNWCVFVYN